MVPEQVWDWYCCSNCYSVLIFFFLFLGPSLSVLSFLLWNLLWLVEEVLSLLWFFLIVRMEISWFLWEMFESRSEGLLNAGLWTTGTLLSFVLLVNPSSLSLWLSLSPLDSNLKLTPNTPVLMSPDFFNWNRVFVRYCDGASFSGNASLPADKKVVALSTTLVSSLVVAGLKNYILWPMVMAVLCFSFLTIFHDLGLDRSSSVVFNLLSSVSLPPSSHRGFCPSTLQFGVKNCCLVKRVRETAAVLKRLLLWVSSIDSWLDWYKLLLLGELAAVKWSLL